MGQRVQGVVYGVFLSIRKLNELSRVYPDWRESLPIGVETGGGDRQVLGFCIAASAAWEQGGEVVFPECMVADLAKELRAPLSAAKKRWKKLVKWSNARGIGLDKPELLLVRVDRA
jgi:hypothetical protein